MENAAEELQKLHRNFLKRLEQMQDQYDSETNHSLNRKNQENWEKRIAAEIAALECYPGNGQYGN